MKEVTKQYTKNNGGKRYALLVPIVKDEVINEEPVGNGKVRQTIKRNVIHFYYCGQKNHTITGDPKTMMLGSKDECKRYSRDRANKVIRACKAKDKENAKYYKLVEV